MVDLGTQFCERCGRDRDSFPSARNLYRDCPACGAACCADCWNLVDGACLACAPFRLIDGTTPPRIVIPAVPGAAVAGAAADPYADLRSDPAQLDSWEASWGTARQRPKEMPPAGAAPTSAAPDAWRAVVAASEPAAKARPRRRAGRIGLAASAAWVVVGALAVAALGASPGSRVVVPPETLATATPAATIAPTAPAATPRATRAPRATAKPRSTGPGRATPRATPRPAPRVTPRATPRHPKATPRPPKPVVVAPPTPEPTPELSPEATPDP
jgi:hypothetical protein